MRIKTHYFVVQVVHTYLKRPGGRPSPPYFREIVNSWPKLTPGFLMVRIFAEVS